MSPEHPSAACPSMQAESTASPATLSPEVNDRLSYLFRATLKSGRVHPLYLPMLRYRLARDGA